MEPTREIYWNISGVVIMYLLALITFGVMGFGLWQRYRLWRMGKPENRADHLWSRLASTLTLSFAHRRMIRESFPGLMHLFIFSGFVTLFVGTALVMVRADLDIDFWKGSYYLFYKLFLNLLGILAIVGLVMAIYRRYVQRPFRLQLGVLSDRYILWGLFIILINGYLIEGIRIAAVELRQHPDWAIWSPGGYVIALAVADLPLDVLRTSHRVLWWFHLVTALAWIGYLPFTKMRHVFTSPTNIFLRSYRPKGELTTIDLENAETYGVGKIEEFTWKDLFDLDACTECGRCTAVCPATAVGKSLNPKEIILDLRDYLSLKQPPLSSLLRFGANGSGQRNAANGELPAMIGNSVQEDELWACTTCRACMQACPVMIEHVPKIVDMRRYLVLNESSFPPEVVSAFKNLEINANPWQFSQSTRADWARGLDVPILGVGAEVDLLFWVGCYGSYDERNKKVSRAFARCLQAAGVRFGILGPEESCTGDPARRIGNEYLYQMMAQQNVEILNGYGVKRIVTTCPHCLNTLKNEYPQFGGNYELIHHSQLLFDLLRDGKLKLKDSADLTLTYHDPCYLGRYNDVYDAPREVLKSIPGVKLLEMAKSRQNSFCCGGGGGRGWMEEPAGKRVNVARTDQAMKTGAQLLGAGCPFCITMFEDGIRQADPTETFRVLDIAELVERALVRADG